MRALPYDQIDDHGRDGGSSLRCGGMGFCRGHRPARPSRALRRHFSSPSRCAVSQLGRSSLLPQRIGRFFSSPREITEFVAMTRAGLAAQVALANVNAQIGHKASNQFADAAEVVQFDLSKLAAFDDLEASEGENGRVPNQAGILPIQRGELPNVGRR